MKKTFYLLTLVSLVLSCSQFNNSKTDEVQEHKKVEENIIQEIRTLHVYDVETFQRFEDYQLDLKTTDSTFVYLYKNTNDSLKNMSFKYYKESKLLYFTGEPFQLIKSDYCFIKSLSDTKFDLYETIEKYDDGMGPILFNKNYGVLNLDNGWGTFFIYLKSENDSLANAIIKETYQ
ncbi:MAG: hypothetical protein ACWA5P_10870 [bacterium]